MLLAHPHKLHTCDLHLSHRIGTPPTAPPMLGFLNMMEQPLQNYQQMTHLATREGSSSSSEVVQALEIARESPDGARDPTISNLLESALASIWGKVHAQPDSYIMSRDEFAIFNFFQHRFQGNKMAIAARRRYWDNLTGGP
ncbi:hypothetical protein F5Y19DRAFT_480201 [Xylariaceae sp. FL1651]|nr:hypothetical protein F5Y19DRAFT_480201 [Xylariaceae sp. FL1651]